MPYSLCYTSLSLTAARFQRASGCGFSMSVSCACALLRCCGPFLSSSDAPVCLRPCVSARRTQSGHHDARRWLRAEARSRAEPSSVALHECSVHSRIRRMRVRISATEPSGEADRGPLTRSARCDPQTQPSACTLRRALAFRNSAPSTLVPSPVASPVVRDGFRCVVLRDVACGILLR